MKQSREKLNKRMHKHAKTSKSKEKLAKSCKHKQNKMQSHKEKMNTKLAHGCDLSGADVLFLKRQNASSAHYGLLHPSPPTSRMADNKNWLRARGARAANFFFNQLNILSKVSEFEGQATVCVFRKLKNDFAEI